MLGDLDRARSRPTAQAAGDVEDAREALAWLTERAPRAPTRPSTRRSRGRAAFPVRYRNVDEVPLRAYPVDLQVLFAVRKTLEGLNRIDLAGHRPRAQWTVPLAGGGRPRGRHEARRGRCRSGEGRRGAWLVVAKAGDLEAGTLVVKTDLTVALQPSARRCASTCADARGRAACAAPT